MSYTSYARRRGMGAESPVCLDDNSHPVCDYNGENCVCGCNEGYQGTPWPLGTGCVKTAQTGGISQIAAMTCKAGGGTWDENTGQCVYPPEPTQPMATCPAGQHYDENGDCVPDFTVPGGGCSPGQIQQPDGSCAPGFSVPGGGCSPGQVQQPDGSCVSAGGPGPGPGPSPNPTPQPGPGPEPVKQASALEKASPWLIAGGLGVLAIALVASSKKPAYTSNKRRSRRRSGGGGSL